MMLKMYSLLLVKTIQWVGLSCFHVPKDVQGCLHVHVPLVEQIWEIDMRHIRR